jgi:hypothetical protein
MNTRYVTDLTAHGWTLAVPDGVDPAAVVKDHRRGLSLLAHLKVNLLKSENGREFFEIAEGVLKGQKASLKLGTGNRSLLAAASPHTRAAAVRLSRKKQQLWYGSKGLVAIVREAESGLYDKFVWLVRPR